MPDTVQHSTAAHTTTPSVPHSSVQGGTAVEQAENLRITENISHLSADRIPPGETAQAEQISHPRSRDTIVPLLPTQLNTFTDPTGPVARISAVNNETFFHRDQLAVNSAPQSSRICNN